MRRRSSIGIYVAQQAIANTNERLIFPRVAAHGTLPHGHVAVFQHSSAPLLEVVPASFESSKRGRQDEKQKQERRDKANSCFPVTPVNEINDGKYRKRFDRSSDCNEAASHDFAFCPQRNKSAKHQGK